MISKIHLLYKDYKYSLISRMVPHNNVMLLYMLHYLISICDGLLSKQHFHVVVGGGD